MPVWRFWNTNSGTHFYTSDEGERDRVAMSLPNMQYEGVSFDNPSQTTGSVWRFYRRDSGAHFYTANAAERDYVIANLGSLYSYEGAAFDASATQTLAAGQPVHRFWNAETGAHFYTADELERQSVAANLPNMRYEGVAYYMAPPPARPDRGGALDEAWYLAAYPDVADAVSAGLTTAARHWQEFGRREGRLPQNSALLAGNDTLTSSYSAPNNGDRMNGGAGNDRLQGGIGNDTIFGETGDDVLTGYQSDYLNGGSGDDTYYVLSSGVVVQEGANGGTDGISLGNVGTYTIPDHIESVTLSPFGSSSETSFLTVTGSNGSDTITMTQYTDLPMGGYSLQYVTVNAGTGNDRITVTGTVNGGDGEDTVNPGYWTAARTYPTTYVSRDDAIDGGNGNDTIYLSKGTDTLTGGAGADSFVVAFPTTLPFTPGPLGVNAALTGVTTITDFQNGADLLRFEGTTLTAQQIADRFTLTPATIPGAAPVLSGTFTASDFTSPYAGGTGIEIRLSGLTQVTAGMIAAL